MAGKDTPVGRVCRFLPTVSARVLYSPQVVCQSTVSAVATRLVAKPFLSIFEKVGH